MTWRPSRALRRFHRREDGAATIEFAILFPAFIAVFISAYESGVMMIRNVMLERAVDIALRDLRLGLVEAPGFDDFKALICDRAFAMADCLNVVQVELEPVSQTNWSWTGMNQATICIDQGSDLNPADETRFSLGSENELMLIRVCALYQPFFPVVVFGMQMPQDAYGNYALVATSAFVNEPQS